MPIASQPLDAAIHVWERLTGIHPHKPENPYYLVKRGDGSRYPDLIKRLSYLAKSRGKGYKASQSKDYGASCIHLRADNDLFF